MAARQVFGEGFVGALHPTVGTHPASADVQPFHVAEVFTSVKGVFVRLEDTIAGFKGIVEGKYDHIPEMAFYMVGTIEEALEKAETMAEEA